MYIIFINDKPFIITAHDVNEAEYAACERVNYEPNKLLEYIKKCESLSSKGMIVLTQSPDEVFRSFTSHFVQVEAAGGLVFNQKGEVLMIKRMGKWDLPKGKIDAGETNSEAAKREVEEECGISGIEIKAQLPTTYHTYKMHNYRFLKVTYWYSMTTDYKGKLVPQTEEQITEVKWMSKAEVLNSELDTYQSIRYLLQTTIGS